MKFRRNLNREKNKTKNSRCVCVCVGYQLPATLLLDDDVVVVDVEVPAANAANFSKFSNTPDGEVADEVPARNLLFVAVLINP